MTKISANTIKKVGWTASGIWLITFLGFMIFTTSIKPTISQPWAEPTATGIVFLIGGSTMLTFCLVYTIAAWSMTADEHHNMLINSSIFGRQNKRSLSFLPKSYWLWQNRILTLLFIPLALTLTGIGVITLIKTYMTYIQ